MNRGGRPPKKRGKTKQRGFSKRKKHEKPVNIVQRNASRKISKIEKEKSVLIDSESLLKQKNNILKRKNDNLKSEYATLCVLSQSSNQHRRSSGSEYTVNDNDNKACDMLFILQSCVLDGVPFTRMANHIVRMNERTKRNCMTRGMKYVEMVEYSTTHIRKMLKTKLVILNYLVLGLAFVVIPSLKSICVGWDDTTKNSVISQHVVSSFNIGPLSARTAPKAQQSSTDVKKNNLYRMFQLQYVQNDAAFYSIGYVEASDKSHSGGTLAAVSSIEMVDKCIEFWKEKPRNYTK